MMRRFLVMGLSALVGTCAAPAYAHKPSDSYLTLNVVGDKRPVRDAMAHLARRFPDLEAQARPARTPPAAWGLVNDGIGALLGVTPATTLEQGIDRMLSMRGA